MALTKEEKKEFLDLSKAVPTKFSEADQITLFKAREDLLTKNNDKLQKDFSTIKQKYDLLNTQYTAEKKDFEAQKLQLAKRESQYRELSDLLSSREKDLSEREKAIALLNTKYTSIKETLEARKNELNKLQNSYDSIVSSVFTPDKLSIYLNKTIEEFNNNQNSSCDYAEYKIKTMDVDLKTNLSIMDDKLVLMPSKLDSNKEDSLSSIKISICAVPKDN